MKPDTTDQLCVNTIRTLAIDMIGKANSGHPGIPLGAAPLAYTLWAKHLKFSPSNPDWFDRDRFVLSAGHGSSMLYALLYLYGYGLTIEDLKNFRQLNSLTPGHPEYGHTRGVEMTTGPLGQGFASAVGMAFAEKVCAEKLNTEDIKLVDHFTYVIAGDGDLMEGVSYEASAFAGVNKLGKLVCLYDSNGITIEGSTKLAFTENIKQRFTAQGWQVLEVEDGNDIFLVDSAIRKAKRETEQPTIIICKTHIGFGSPKQDMNTVHGEPLKPEEIAATKEKLGWPSKESFFVPEEAKERFLEETVSAEKEWKHWLKTWKALSDKYPEKAQLAKEMLGRDIPEDLFSVGDDFFDKPEMATRAASGQIINLMADRLPGLTGGAADLGPSTKTDFKKEPGRTVHFGIREHAMGAIINGMALHGGLIPFGATFLVFSDYMRPSIRLAAMMKSPSIFLFTHDSIGVGEDGPTHQPIEHLMSLRLIPGLTVMRPADAWETLYCWEEAIRSRKPVCMALSRQNLPVLKDYRAKAAAGVNKGAYVLQDPMVLPSVILVASGSEVSVMLKAVDLLARDGVMARVVSVPSIELFAKQSQEYKDSVLIPNVPRVVLEAGRTTGWTDFCGFDSYVMGIDRYGMSGPAGKVYEALGLTPEAVASIAKKMI